MDEEGLKAASFDIILLDVLSPIISPKVGVVQRILPFFNAVMLIAAPFFRFTFIKAYFATPWLFHTTKLSCLIARKLMQRYCEN